MVWDSDHHGKIIARVACDGCVSINEDVLEAVLDVVVVVMEFEAEVVVEDVLEAGVPVVEDVLDDADGVPIRISGSSYVCRQEPSLFIVHTLNY